MKKLFTILVSAVLLTASAFTQTPQKFSYQAVIRNGSDQLVTNQTIGIRISILHGSISGTAVYQETQTPTSNANGLVTIEIGSGTTMYNFSAIDWASGPYFIKTEIDPAGITNYTITGTSQLLSVPYALYAKTAENGFSGNYEDLNNKPVSIDEDKTDDVTISGNQSIGGNKTYTGSISVPAPVNATDAATKDYVDGILRTLGILPNNYTGLVTDIEGNNYKTVTIGTQIWMAENLRTATLNNGSELSIFVGAMNWSASTTPGYCWYNDDAVASRANYGALYNWYAINTGNLCPTNWHAPTDAEWSELETYLGGISIAAGKLKENGTMHWASPNEGATNESGFTALPGGGRDINGVFYSATNVGYWWSATEASSISALYRLMDFELTSVFRSTVEKQAGFSVRCVKD